MPRRLVREGRLVHPAPEADRALERLATSGRIVVLLGGADTGKTTFGVGLADRARSLGRSVAFVDADVNNSTVGPPTCLGLKYVREEAYSVADGTAEPDGLWFVGNIFAEGNLLALATGTACLVHRAREAGCDLVIVDTSSLISGIGAQMLGYFTAELVRPDAVVGFQRGEELEPMLGLIRRFFAIEPTILPVDPGVVERTIEERLTYREDRLRSYFARPLSRWRVRTTVFMPTVSPESDLSRLDGLVVGLEDGGGACMGIGLLEHDPGEDVLRMVSPVSESARGLRLGTIRITTDGRILGRVSLREILGTD